MFAQFRYLDGPKNGEVKVVGNDFATIGRDPAAEVRFDPEQDIEVSIRHAAVFKQGGGFLIRDLGSTNGTFLNGARVRGDRPLEVGDVIQLGPSGPRIEFGAATTPPHAARNAGTDHAAVRAATSEIYRPKPRPTGRVGQLKPPKRSGWRWLVAAIVIAGAGIGAATAYRAREAAAAALATQRATLQGRIDEFRARLDLATSPVTGLSAAIAAAKAATGALSAAVAATDMTGPGLDSAATRLDALAARHQPLLAASGFDPAALRPAATGRVAAVIGEFDRGRVATATAFVVHRAGDTVWLATDRLVAIDSAGRPAGRFAVIFDGARVALLGRLVRTDDTASVAILAVIRSDPPAAVTVGETPAAGTPVAQIGFPFGADSLGAWRQTGATLSTSVATLTTAAPSEVGLETYGGRAWPGSPVVVGTGAVIGMATRGGGGVRVVPVAVILRLAAPR
ncbi:MAG: FHA domain-containing protein [Gemmatimonadales bacterium]